MPTLSLDRLQHIRSSLRSVLTWRIVVLAAIVLVVFTGGQRLLGSLFLSAGMVRQQIHEAVLRQTGLQFLVNGETSISFWPSPYITLKNVDVIRSDAANEQPVFHADAISGRFDVVSALTGSPQFGSITLTRPVFRVDDAARREPTYGRRPLGPKALARQRWTICISAGSRWWTACWNSAS